MKLYIGQPDERLGPVSLGRWVAYWLAEPLVWLGHQGARVQDRALYPDADPDEPF